MFQPAAAVLSVGDDQLPSLESFCTDTNMGSWQNVVLDTIGDIGLASPYHETPEQFSTSITENPQTSYQAVTTALANPTVCSDALTPMEKDAAHPVVAEQEPTLPRKRRRSRTRPVPGYSCFVLGPVSAERERRKMNNDQKRNRKEVVQAGGSCFLCRLDKKKVGDFL